MTRVRVLVPLVAGLSAAAVAGPSSPSAVSPRGACAALQPGDPLATTRAGFVREVLDPAPTRRTPLFHNPGRSYTVDAGDLAAALLAESRACGRRLRGGVVIGPSGPIWEYQVVVLLGEPGDRTRVNFLRFPHGRITFKATGVLPAAAADSLLDALFTSPLLGSGPTPTTTVDREGGADVRPYDVLAFRRGESAVQARYGAFARPAVDTAEVRRLTERLNAVLTRLRPTYRTQGRAITR